MSNIMDYVVITSSKGVENLESLIKENIRLGWQPIGGVAVMGSSLVQAMVKYDN